MDDDILFFSDHFSKPFMYQITFPSEAWCAEKPEQESISSHGSLSSKFALQRDINRGCTRTVLVHHPAPLLFSCCDVLKNEKEQVPDLFPFLSPTDNSNCLPDGNKRIWYPQPVIEISLSDHISTKCQKKKINMVVALYDHISSSNQGK